MNKVWFEVLKSTDEGTKTIADFDTKKEAIDFVYNYSLNHDASNLSIDAWEMRNGIPNKLKPHTMIVKNDYTDEQNFTHIDAWVDDNEEGRTIAIVCRDTKKVYFAENMYRDEPMVLTAISQVLESLN